MPKSNSGRRLSGSRRSSSLKSSMSSKRLSGEDSEELISYRVKTTKLPILFGDKIRTRIFPDTRGPDSRHKVLKIKPPHVGNLKHDVVIQGGRETWYWDPSFSMWSEMPSEDAMKSFGGVSLEPYIRIPRSENQDLFKNLGIDTEDNNLYVREDKLVEIENSKGGGKSKRTRKSKKRTRKSKRTKKSKKRTNKSKNRRRR